jgi:hypothetical protein
MKPQIGIRDMCWLMLAVALACGWWLDRTQLRDWHEFRFRSLKGTVERRLENVTVDSNGKVTDSNRIWLP